MCMKCDFNALNLSNAEDQIKARAMINILMNQLNSCDEILMELLKNGEYNKTEVENSYYGCELCLTDDPKAKEIREKAIDIRVGILKAAESVQGTESKLH